VAIETTRERWAQLLRDVTTRMCPLFAQEQVVALSQRIEEVFGWGKTVGPLAQTMLRGAERVGAQFTFTVAGYKSRPAAETARSMTRRGQPWRARAAPKGKPFYRHRFSAARYSYCVKKNRDGFALSGASSMDIEVMVSQGRRRSCVGWL
jgi:hypothetical protein